MTELYYEIDTKMWLYFPNFRLIYNFLIVLWQRCFTKRPPTAILDYWKSLSIAFLAISDQYATLSYGVHKLFHHIFTKWPSAAILVFRFSSKSIGFFHYRSSSMAVSYKYLIHTLCRSYVKHKPWRMAAATARRPKQNHKLHKYGPERKPYSNQRVRPSVTDNSVRFSSKTTQPIYPMLISIYRGNNVDLQRILHVDLHPYMTAGQGHEIL